MAEGKDEKKDNKRPKRTTKIVYFRCQVCGRRQQESEKVSPHNKAAFCEECTKHSKWAFDGYLQRKGVKK